MNIAAIFAGGVGRRMNTSSVPKQFLKLHDKEIIIYTLEHFEKSPLIDAIVIASLEEWIPYLQEIVHKHRLSKVKKIVPGGANGQESIYHTLLAAADVAKKDNSNINEATVLIHDGVRPLINQQVIKDAINSVKRHGNAIVTAPAIETIICINDDHSIADIIDRAHCQMARAPQCFYLKEVLDAHNKARSDGKLNFIDTASLMKFYGYKLFTVEGPAENIKITTPNDFYMFKAYYEAKEASNILGL